MNAQKYQEVVGELERDRKQVAKGKREDYTRGDVDVLANFKNQGEACGVRPEQSLLVHMEKQFSAVMNFIKTEGKSESEPIIKRIGDTINYLELAWALFNERGLVTKPKKSKDIIGYCTDGEMPIKRFYLEDNPDFLPPNYIPPMGVVATRGTELVAHTGKTFTVDVKSIYLIPIYE